MSQGPRSCYSLGRVYEEDYAAPTQASTLQMCDLGTCGHQDTCPVSCWPHGSGGQGARTPLQRKGEGQEKEQEMSWEVTTPESPTRVISSPLADLSHA